MQNLNDTRLNHTFEVFYPHNKLYLTWRHAMRIVMDISKCYCHHFCLTFTARVLRLIGRYCFFVLFFFFVEDDNSADITWHDGSTVEDMQPFSLNPYTPNNQLGKCGSLSYSTSKHKDRLSNWRSAEKNRHTENVQGFLNFIKYKGKKFPPISGTQVLSFYLQLILKTFSLKPTM